MILRIAGRTWCGGVVDLRGEDVDREALVAAIRGYPCTTDSSYGAHCPPPQAVHYRAGVVRPGMTLEPRTALAAAGRSRGLSTPDDDALVEVREELSTFAEATQRSGEPTTASAADRERLRERVAELRGHVQALEACDRDAGDERATLRDAARRLSELETERIAAVETRTQARELRDRRERRLRLQDREANLERAARAHLVDTLADEFAAAVASLAPAIDDPFDADQVTAALAVLRVATVRAPVVLDVDRFDGDDCGIDVDDPCPLVVNDPASAAAWLGAPIIRL